MTRFSVACYPVAVIVAWLKGGRPERFVFPGSIYSRGPVAGTPGGRTPGPAGSAA